MDMMLAYIKNKKFGSREINMKNILEKTGLIDVTFYITAIGYGIFFWLLCNVVFRNDRKK